MKPKLLDLFCKAGGASVGYARAGFEVEGVDIEPQPNYPFKFYQADALTFPLEGYDAYAASPPCQDDSIATQKWKNRGYVYPQLIEPTRQMLIKTGKPYAIENVTGAKRRLNNPILLCGLTFGLKVVRHRWFEVEPFILSPGHSSRQCHGAVTRQIAINDPAGHGMPGHTYRALTVAGHGGNSQSFRWQDWKEAMGIDWMTKQELTQAIPPAYTEYIGKYLIQAL
ncbi:hypothetical protein LCGC14_0527710 [marine sediment metagenome]|uniref:DNA (cytosine-5-)-methyltransferase n=1 Tax=marine sediment metagenome TaxID=412755 RepID=A0A0F9RWW9_9ZZZZ